MSANVYTIEEALKGTYYRSNTTSGTIEYAEKRDDVWYGSNDEAYLVTIRPDYGIRYQYRTIAVRIR
jgi:hypothetical protein